VRKNESGEVQCLKRKKGEKETEDISSWGQLNASNVESWGHYGFQPEMCEKV